MKVTLRHEDIRETAKKVPGKGAAHKQKRKSESTKTEAPREIEGH